MKRASHFTKSEQFRASVDSLLPKAQEIEDLSPEGPDHPNPEYPWEVNGVVVSPLDYAFSTPDAKKDARMRKLLRFIAACFELS